MKNQIKKQDEKQNLINEEVLKYAIAGASFHDIKKTVLDKVEGSTVENINNALEGVLIYFKSMAEFNPEVERGKNIARLNLLFLNSMKIQDYKTCLQIQKEINKALDNSLNIPQSDFDFDLEDYE